MAKWQSHSESGILRKNIVSENHDDLLVFGYACKLFRDDDKALYIDKGKQLIPWMGNDNLKIDRYDGRGALSELSQFEASREGYDAMRWLGLSESERKIEQLCDDERYYALKVNEEEETMYKEEEWKRLQQKNNEFQFNYDVQPEPQSQKVSAVEAEDEPFIPTPDLDVPSDIAVPSTVKENIRIEKTALFVSKQGLQMEILIKTKQADNPQFSFLNQHDILHKYYKHLLMIIKSGRYKIQSKENCPEEEQEESNENESSDEHYLHPSLLATSVPAVQSASAPNPMPYKPSANCKYFQLVNRIQGNQQQYSPPISATPTLAISLPNQPETIPTQHVPYEQQHYYQQYYYAMQYYEYYKQMAQQYTVEGGEMDPKVVQYFQSLSHLYSCLQSQGMPNLNEMQNAQTNENPYAKIVTNVIQNKDFPPATEALVPVQINQQIESNITKGPIIYKQEIVRENSIFNHNTPESDTPLASPKTTEPPSEPSQTSQTVQKHPILHFAHYSSDSEENTDDEISKNIDFPKVSTVPSQEVQLIIEKMASYVSKNGVEFEASVRGKGDPRFQFLNEGHEFHSFYKEKLDECLEIKRKTEETNRQIEESKTKEKKIIAPVSFSIKKTKEESSKEIKNALPIEESDEDEGGKMDSVQPNCSPSRTPPLRDLLLHRYKIRSSEVQIKSKKTEENSDTIVLDGEDPIFEMIDLTDDIEERRENKRAEDKKKDKIVAVARERLALQLERKRKAAAFLKLMSVDGSNTESIARHVSVSKSSSKTKDKHKSGVNSSKELTKKKGTKEHESRNSKRHHKSSKKKKSSKRKHVKDKHQSKHRTKDKKSKRRRRSKSGERDKSYS